MISLPRIGRLPTKLRLEASSVCQLKCHSCPTASGAINKAIGTGMLRFDNFKKLVDENPQLTKIELSNYGEIFLNKELPQIFKHAHEKGIVLTADNGVNFNTVREDALEAAVKYKIRALRLSIDGASQEVYEKYRAKGNFDAVIENIKKLNAIKEKYQSGTPKLYWQYIVFGHNEKEIPKAKKMAQELEMTISFKLNWDETFSPIQDPDFVKRETGLSVTSRKEHLETTGNEYMGKICYQLWFCPQINFDGKVLGCCRNFWGDFGGNALTEGLAKALKHEKLLYGRDMLLGKKQAREDVPCTDCEVYIRMQENGKWLEEKQLRRHRLREIVSESKLLQTVARMFRSVRPHKNHSRTAGAQSDMPVYGIQRG